MSEIERSFNKICGRLCAELTGRLVSPLSIGSGEQEYSDADIVFNAQGEPYIPGSSLAGVLRDYGNALKGKVETNHLFGNPKNGIPGSKDDRQSRIYIYNASIRQAETGVRDGVKLNKNKTASHMGKYELQYVDRDAEIKIRVEILERDDFLKETQGIQEAWKKDQQWIQLWIQGFTKGELRLGARSRRGFGRIEIERVRIKKFDMRDKDSYMEWLDWDWEQPNAFCGAKSEELPVHSPESEAGPRLEHCLELPIHIPGTLLVRTYATAFARKQGIPDYGQMTAGGKEEQAVIPGSSLAGAFRSHIAKIVKELGKLPTWEAAQKRLEPLFGTWTDRKKKNQELRASRVIFEETVVQGGHGLPTARIAVDRFTGGTVQGALYEEIPWAGGNAMLRIRWKKDGSELTDEAICGMLLWAVKDLHSGILAVGGENSVGRGIFEPESGKPCILLDGEPLEEARQGTYMRAAAVWARDAANDE